MFDGKNGAEIIGRMKDAESGDFNESTMAVCFTDGSSLFVETGDWITFAGEEQWVEVYRADAFGALYEPAV